MKLIRDIDNVPANYLKCVILPIFDRFRLYWLEILYIIIYLNITSWIFSDVCVFQEIFVSQSIDVAYVSELARIALTAEETKLFQGQLETIVDYIEKINELDLDNIKPTMHGQLATNFFRDDVVCPSLEREAVLCNAPARTESEFKLPKIVEDA